MNAAPRNADRWLSEVFDIEDVPTMPWCSMPVAARFVHTLLSEAYTALPPIDHVNTARAIIENHILAMLRAYADGGDLSSFEPDEVSVHHSDVRARAYWAARRYKAEIRRIPVPGEYEAAQDLARR